MIRFFAVIVIILSISNYSFITAEENSPPSESERFSKSTLEEQKKILLEAFKKRIEFAKNLFYRNEIHTGVQEIKDGRGTTPTGKNSVRRDYVHWQLNNDYKYEISFFDPNRSDASQWSIACWDSKEGIQRSTVKNESLDRIFARIDTVFEKALLLNNVYSFWLQGGSSAEFPIPPYLFLHLLEHQNEWDITFLAEENKVRLIVPYKADEGFITTQSEKGEMTLFLDPNKQFIPIHGTLRGDVTLKDGRTPWREETFEVKESKLINDIWMPFKLTIYVRADVLHGKVSETTINVTEMEQGKVTKSDVTMKFSENTEVTDAINGISYKTDINGNPIESTIEPLHGLDPSQVKMPAKKRGTINYVLMFLGIALITIALFIQFRKRQKKS